MKLLSKVLATLVFGLFAVLAMTPLAATMADTGYRGLLFMAFISAVGLACFTAPTGRRAWGRGSLIIGVLFLALPMTITGLSGHAASEVIREAAVANQAATAVGAAIGGGLVVGASAMISFILGTIFIVMGLVLTLGGRRKVVVVNDQVA